MAIITMWNIVIYLIIISILLILSMCLVFVLYIILFQYGFQNTSMSLTMPDDNWFKNFDVFKKKVLEFAEQDEEINNYLQARKNRNAHRTTNISYSRV